MLPILKLQFFVKSVSVISGAVGAEVYSVESSAYIDILALLKVSR